MMNNAVRGHLAALLTISIWGTTFISTKVLLADFQPIEILFFRFLMGIMALLTVCPHRLRRTALRQEIVFAAAGLCGVCLYYLLEIWPSPAQWPPMWALLFQQPHFLRRFYPACP